MRPNIIQAHQSGELYIHRAMLIANPGSTVIVSANADATFAAWEQAAEKKHQDVLDLLSERHRQRFASRQQARDFLQPRLETAANEMRDFLLTGIPSPLDRNNQLRVRIERSDTTYIKHSTKAAVEPFTEDPDQAANVLRGAIARGVPESSMRGRLRDFYLSRFSSGDSYVLLWGRTSGRTNAALPHLDTNAVMLGQMMQRIRNSDPTRKLVFIGDPVTRPSTLGDDAFPQPDLDLTRYWTAPDWPGEDRASQMFFLSLIHAHHPNTISIGTNSGILELPHLLGLKTIYLENQHEDLRKGRRWEKKWPMGNIGRLVTSAATEFQGRKAVLFEEVRDWIHDNGRFMPGTWPGEQDVLLQKLMTLASLDQHARGPAGQPRAFANTLHQAQRSFQTLRQDPFTASGASTALARMESSLGRDGLTATELEQFEALWDAAVSGHHMQAALNSYQDARRELQPTSTPPPDTSALDPSTA